MEIVISIAAKIAEYTVAPIGRQLDYLCFYNAHVAELQTQNNRLGHAAGRLQRKVEEAEATGEVIEADVKECLTNIGDFTREIETFTREEEQANTKCSMIRPKFANVVLRHQFGRRAKKMAQNIVTQIQEAEKFIPVIEVSYCPRQPISSATENEGFVEFKTRKKNLRDVMEALKDPNIGKVGVWGMGGVGKTMLTKEVARRSKDEEKLFTQVIFVTISQTPNLENIRQDILNGLGMGPISPQEYLDRLRNRLSKEDKVLVIVDDVWDKFDLKKVGVSFGSDKKGCKILVTSRNQHVLEGYMGVDRNFLVGVLGEPEAISLFHKTLGNQAANVKHHHDFQHLATMIVRECGGLPIAITTVASALKNKSIHVWKNALRELQNSNPINIQGVHEKVYSSIKLSYDFLASEEAKELLLLCGLFPEDANMDVREDLFSYCIGLNLFKGGISTLEEARNRTFTLVGNLKDHSLLLDGSDASRPNCVKLHDVIRDVAIFIASNKFGDGHGRHPMHTIRNAAELEAYFETGKFKDSKAISLYLVDDDQSPETLKSPELKILKVKYSSYTYLRLVHQFFGGLSKLLVLDLQKVALEAFPPSSSFCPPFPNLRTLRLNYCKFGNTSTSWIGELNNLRILDLSDSDIVELPTEIGNLNRLLSLRLNYCYSLEVIRPNVLSRLTHLEDLELVRSFENWEKPDGVDNANVGELWNLPRLTTLPSLVVRDVNLIPKDMMFSEKLENYNICIGPYSRWFSHWIENITSTRTLKLDLSESSALNEHDFIALLKRSDALCLTGLKSSVKSVAYELHNRGFPQLKQLALADSAQIRCIVDNNYLNHHHEDNYPPAAAAFPNLERLLLHGLSNFEHVVINIHDETTMFGKLSEIQVESCDRLRSVISLDNINPRLLNKIEVYNCEMMEEIITITPTRGKDGDHLPKHTLAISHLDLARLPKLVQFTATTKSDDSDMPFFNGQVEFPKLETLQLDSLNFRKIWNDKLPSSRLAFQSLTTLKVWSCDNLKGVIPLSTIGSDLVNLKTLWVKTCKAMKEVVFTEEYSAQDAKMTSLMEVKKISFPKLEELQLIELPNLERFCAGDCVDFPSLLTLDMDDCPKLGAFMTSFMPMMENEIENSISSLDKRRRFDDKKSEIRSQLPDHQQSGGGGGGGVEQQEHDDDDDMVIKTTRSNENGYSRDIFFFKTSFRSLKTLKVTGLHDVTSLFYSSAVPKSLPQLSKLKVGECDSLRHVVVLSPNFDDGRGDGGSSSGVAAAAAGNNSSSSNIVFSKLKIVLLDDLPNLTSFFSSYSGNNNNVVLEFPLLNKLAVGLCPKMTTFSHPAHHIVCPSLRNIIVYESKASDFWTWRLARRLDNLGTRKDNRPQQHRWEGDVNTTIQKLWQINNTSTTTAIPQQQQEINY